MTILKYCLSWNPYLYKFLIKIIENSYSEICE